MSPSFATSAVLGLLHTLTDDEKAEYIRAEKCLMAKPAQLGINGTQNRWDELQMSHIIQSNDIHDVGQFWPWHRYYMRVHEVLLQQECNYTGAQPYWDEQRDSDAGPIEDASVFGSDDLSFGSNGREGDRCVVDGPFANSTLRLDQAWGVIDYEEYCLGRNFSSPDTGYWAWANSTFADTCFAATTYDDAWSCYSVKPHSSAHLAVSGTLELQSASPGDPLFYLHHTNIDRLWWEWQQVNLTYRLTDMGGRNVPRDDHLLKNEWIAPTAAVLDYDGDDANVTTLNHVLWMLEILPNVTVADVMDIRGDTICAEYIHEDE
ncbi:hypothetical protein Daus18300_001491 [Diaporthe australafricana]|uniref:Tyrosinase copper-binding domain-containing protein n=1 Tax=Diaporthe australafricana TaxID=127596 RepID=A0ABR3XVU1_9PEZI